MPYHEVRSTCRNIITADNVHARYGTSIDYESIDAEPAPRGEGTKYHTQLPCQIKQKKRRRNKEETSNEVGEKKKKLLLEFRAMLYKRSSLYLYPKLYNFTRQRFLHITNTHRDRATKKG